MRNTKFMDWPFLLFLFFGVIGPVGTKVYLIYNHALYNYPFTWLDEQPKLNPQERSDLFSDGIGMQAKVEGTVARNAGVQEYVDLTKNEDLKEYYANPLLLTKEVLEKGQKQYSVYCGVCHGPLGEGADTGTLRGGHFAPPSLHSGVLKNETDGYFYQIIVNGRNTMPSYAKQIPVENRWAIVHYIRALQRAKDAKKSDLSVKLETSAVEESHSAEEGHH